MHMDNFLSMLLIAVFILGMVFEIIHSTNCFSLIFFLAISLIDGFWKNFSLFTEYRIKYYVFKVAGLLSIGSLL